MKAALALLLFPTLALAATTATVTVQPTFDLYQGTSKVSPAVTRPTFTECVEAGRLLNKGTACQSRNGRFALATVAEPVRTASLTWDAVAQNTDGSAVIGAVTYRVYHGTSAAALTDVVPVAATAYQFTALSSGTHYFAVSAVSAAGIESAKSAMGSKVIP
jgi:hypothetical protein